MQVPVEKLNSRTNGMIGLCVGNGSDGDFAFANNVSGINEYIVYLI